MLLSPRRWILMMLATAMMPGSCLAFSAPTPMKSLGFQAMPGLSLGKGSGSLNGLRRRGQVAQRSMANTLMAREKKDGDFDLLDGKDFDLLALRSFRREARIKYSNLNQSEPLRIYLSGLITFFALSYPAICEALQDPITDAQRLQAILIAIPSFAAFLRERGRRTAQLVRMDKECAIGDLALTAVDAMTGARQTFSVRELRNKRRLMAFYGDKAYLRKALAEASVYRRRFLTSQMAVVAVSTDGSTRDEWELPVGTDKSRGAWLWGASVTKDWIDYFEILLEGKMEEGGETGSWIALNMKGRSCASGLGMPIVDELLGSKMPPMNFIPEEDAPVTGNGVGEEVAQEVYDAQSRFYDALTTGKVADMKGMWGPEEDAGVSEFVGLGGRLDLWENQLKDGARPEGMTINSRDVLVLGGGNGNEAVTTCIEVPATGMGQTLLATQRWRRDAEGAWKLAGHKTIPYSVNSGALAVLRCDGRGCVCGLREKDRANRNPFVMPMP